MSVSDTIRAKLSRAFDPVRLDIHDDSARHAGHAGAAPGGETHFRVDLVAEAFHGLSRVERQRRVHAVLREELQTRVHALALNLRTPDEVAHT